LLLSLLSRGNLSLEPEVPNLAGQNRHAALLFRQHDTE
jgi:hypothetical protein